MTTRDKTIVECTVYQIAEHQKPSFYYRTNGIFGPFNVLYRFVFKTCINAHDVHLLHEFAFL